MTIKKASVPYKSYIQYTIVFLVGLYMGLNILFSQMISPWYFIGLKDEKGSIVPYLQAIRPLAPFFQGELDRATALYGSWVEQEVYAVDSTRDAKINLLEQYLVNNPKSRDILYTLHQLYEEKGDQMKSLEYLQRARVIDPELK